MIEEHGHTGIAGDGKRIDFSTLMNFHPYGSTVPTVAPTNPRDAIYVYKNGTDYRLYIYSFTDAAWTYIGSGGSFTPTLQFKNGIDTYNLATASGTKNIAHGLGKVPSYIRLTAMLANPLYDNNLYWAMGTYNGTTTASVGGRAVGSTNSILDQSSTNVLYAVPVDGSSGNQVATVTFDATNIILSWTKTSTPTGTIYLVWEAFG